MRPLIYYPKPMNMKKLNTRFLAITASALLLFPATSLGRSKNVLDLKYSIEDSSIIYPESFEMDSQKLLERWYLKNYTTADIEATDKNDPGATDDEIRDRLANLPTIIDMPFNSVVKQHIERYTKKGRGQVTALLGLSSYYMPIFEQALEEAGLPLELKYLPVIESALDPTATSKSGAAGLWQFILAAARGYDMEVTSLVDERRDPYISSNRACRMLRDLYNTYGDWSLAIAAYNCGPGTVNKALKRAGGDSSTHDFWSIYYYLPAETRGYVPAFIAANYVMNYYPEHNIAPVLPTKPLVTDTVHITNRVNLNQIAEVLDIPVEEIRILNPQFRADVIPATASHPYNLILPSQQIHAYLVSEDQILAYDSEKYARRTDATPGGDPSSTPVEEEPYNPADPAPVEAAAAELAYEQTHPVETTTATPSRRRHNSSSSSTTSQTTSSASSSASTNTSSASSTTKATASTNTQSKTATTKTQTATASSSSSNSTTTKKTTKKSETTAKQSAASQTKKQTKTETATTQTKKQTKGNNTTTASTKSSSKTTTASTKKDTKKDSKKDTKQTASTSTKKQTASQHSVASGENLTTIAKKHGVSVEDLKKANPGKGDKIKPGEKLTIPSKSTAKSSGKSTTASKGTKDTKSASKGKTDTKSKSTSTKSSSTSKNKGKKK